MSNGTVVQLAPGQVLDEGSQHALVAAQLRGEARAERDGSPVVDAVAREIEALGMEPDRTELRRRYADATPAALQAALRPTG